MKSQKDFKKRPKPKKNRLEILNSREMKPIKKCILEQFGYEWDLDLVMLMTNKGKVYVVHKDVALADDTKLRIDAVGMYLGEYRENEGFRLSIEGSQLIGPMSSKNILELNREQLENWVKGEEMDWELGNMKRSFYLIKHENDFFGTGKLTGHKLLNFIPKTRRLKDISD